MKIGEEICVKRDKIYGERAFKYQAGVICGIYRHHILVEFRYANGNSYKESFYEYELTKREEMSENAYIY